MTKDKERDDALIAEALARLVSVIKMAGVGNLSKGAKGDE